MPDRPLVVLLGPTAVGKTALSLALAEECSGEIVSADSTLFYRGMDIGTAKPTPAERRRVVHHLIDIADPDRALSLAVYQRLAVAAIADVQQRGRLPFLVGGSAQYTFALTQGWQVPEVPPDSEFRARLEREAEAIGTPALHARLAERDPDAAAKILPGNLRRIIRALEVIHYTGQRFSALQRKLPPPWTALKLGLTAERGELYRRIDARIDRMLEAGLVDEVAGLLAKGFGLDLPPLHGLGYWQIGLYLTGQLGYEEAVARLRADTRRYVRRQYAWFRRDPEIRWLDATAGLPVGPARDLVAAFRLT